MEKTKNGMTAPNPEVAATPRRRHFAAAEKLRIVKEADNCSESGQIAALLRREGIYSSNLHEWRKARDQGALANLSHKRGPKSARRDPVAKENARLQKENARLKRRLEQAETIIEVQKKIAGILGLPLKTVDLDESDS